MEETKRNILKKCMEEGFLIDRNILEILISLNENFSLNLISSLSKLKISEKVINKQVIKKNYINLKKIQINKEYEVIFDDFLNKLGLEIKERIENKSEIKSTKEEYPVKVLSSNIVNPKKVEVKDFVKHFRNRYERLSNILQERDLENLKSLRRIANEQQTFNIIVAIMNKRSTKNKNLIFEVEDLTGSSRVLVNFNKPELYEKCKDILIDEIVAFNVSGNGEILFANDVVFPDTVLHERKKSKEEVLVAFTSDIHVGSKMFLEKEFLKFIKWINGEEGDEKQKEQAKKIKYLFLTGDNIDGVGVFPGQEELLEIPETVAQYKKLTGYLKLFRRDLQIIMCPGQHDAVWVGEPQPAIGEDWAPELYELSNLTLVTNPCLVEIFSGFKVLMYHGASMHGIIEEIPEIRLNYGHNSPTIVVKEMLKRRHLSPMHGNCDYVPLEDKDPLIIDPVPDIIATGDQHRQEVSMYNNILLVSSSCWQSKTPFEEKVGNNPDPCKVPVFNLKTREVKIFDFSSKDKQEKKEKGLEENKLEMEAKV